MKYKSIAKKLEGKYITKYDVEYETEEGRTKIYEMVSRSNNIQTFEQLHGKVADAVVIIVTNESEDKILINREFRLAPGEWVYNFPAGLIDKGETPEIAAKRELMEETGLELYEIDDFIGTSYSAVGFSNETNVCIVGKARGKLRNSTYDVEEIDAGWFTKEQVRELLRTEKFAARTQAFAYMWSRT